MPKEGLTLKEYPKLPIDSFMDFEFTRGAIGRGIASFSIEEKKILNGKIIVYKTYLREGNEIIDTSLGLRRICETDFEIHGYKVEMKKRWYQFFQPEPKIEEIQLSERKDVENLLRNIQSKNKNIRMGKIYFN